MSAAPSSAVRCRSCGSGATVVGTSRTGDQVRQCATCGKRVAETSATRRPPLRKMWWVD